MQLRGRQTQFYIDILYGLGFAAGFGYLLFVGMDPRVAAFQGGLVFGYILRVWENMSVYERILQEEVAAEAEDAVADEIEETMPDEVEKAVAEEVAGAVAEEAETAVPEEVEKQVADEVEERVTEEMKKRSGDRVPEKVQQVAEQRAGDTEKSGNTSKSQDEKERRPE